MLLARQCRARSDAIQQRKKMTPSPHIDSIVAANSAQLRSAQCADDVEIARQPQGRRLFHRIKEQHDRPDLLFQPDPPYSRPSKFRAKSWTDTKSGYKR